VAGGEPSYTGDGPQNISLPNTVRAVQCTLTKGTSVNRILESSLGRRRVATCAADNPPEPREVCSVFPRCANLQLRMARWFVGIRHGLHFFATAERVPAFSSSPRTANGNSHVSICNWALPRRGGRRRGMINLRSRRSQLRNVHIRRGYSEPAERQL
jgi:hypothetical protein